MPRILDTLGHASPEISLKTPTFGVENVTSAFDVSAVDFVRVQGWEVNGAAWDSGTVDVEWSLDGQNWVSSGTSLSADGITSQVDVSSISFIRAAKGTDASATTPIVRVIVYGEVDR